MLAYDIDVDGALDLAANGLRVAELALDGATKIATAVHNLKGLPKESAHVLKRYLADLEKRREIVALLQAAIVNLKLQRALVAAPVGEHVS